MLSKILRSAVVAAFAVGATVAQADPFADPTTQGKTGSFYWDGQAIANGYVSQQGVAVSVPSFSGTAGLFNGRFNPDGTLDATDAFTFFCIDVWEFVSSQGSENTSYKRNSVTPGLSNATTNDDQQLRNLFSAYAWPTSGTLSNKALQSAAMQLAIWNIIYDDDAAVDAGIGFKASGTAATIDLANAMMAAAQTEPTLDGVYTLFTFVSLDDPTTTAKEGKQDFIAYTFKPNPPDLNVPLPGTLALFGIGLAGLGVARRKAAH